MRLRPGLLVPSNGTWSSSEVVATGSPRRTAPQERRLGRLEAAPRPGLEPSQSPGLDSVVGYGVDDGHMRTGELAEQAGVHVETLRYYERRGLLEAPERSPSGYRSYSPDAVRVVRFVKRAQEVGFTLDDVAELLDLADGDAESCAVARTTAASRLEDLDRRIADLAAMRGALASLVQTCERPRARRTRPLVDALNQDTAEVTRS